MFKKLLIALCLIATTQLPAMNISMGKQGNPIEREGILWQPVRYENTDDKRAVYAEMPGNPRVVFTNGPSGISSNFEDTFYELQILPKLKFKNAKAYALDLQQKNEGVKAWEVKKSNQKKCTYVVAWERTVDGVIRGAGRVFVTSQGAYNFFIDGDLTLADPFFNSVKIVN